LRHLGEDEIDVVLRLFKLAVQQGRSQRRGDAYSVRTWSL
jgi:hypothetical protein